MSYELKYLKYKNKYLELRTFVKHNILTSNKNMIGGQTDDEKKLIDAKIDPLVIEDIIKENIDVDKVIHFMKELNGIENTLARSEMTYQLALIKEPINMETFKFLKTHIFDKNIVIPGSSSLNVLFTFSEKQLNVLKSLIENHKNKILMNNMLDNMIIYKIQSIKESELTPSKVLEKKNIIGGTIDNSIEDLKKQGITDDTIQFIINGTFDINKALEFIQKLNGITDIKDKNSLLRQLLLMNEKKTISPYNLKLLEEYIFNNNIYINDSNIISLILNFSEKKRNILKDLIQYHRNDILERTNIGVTLDTLVIHIIYEMNEDEITSAKVISERKENKQQFNELRVNTRPHRH